MDIADYIEQRLDQMLARPLNWGGAEAFELQVLLLLELRDVLRAASVGSVSLRAHLDRYTTFLRTRRSDLGPRPLSAVTDDLELIARLLEEFRTLDGSLQHVRTSADPENDVPSAPTNLGLDVSVDPIDPTMPRAA